MTKPLVVFTGAALATLAVLLGVTADKWKVQSVSATGAQLSSGSADAAPPAPATAKAEKQDAAALGKTGTDDASGAALPPAEMAAVSPEVPAPLSPAPSVDPGLLSDDSKPSFDTIRVEPDGSAVMAGRGLPDSEVAILFNDQPIGLARTDAAGAWVLVPTEPLPVGDHQVTLRMQQPNAPPVISEQSVALKVPERGTDQAMVVLSEENQPSKVLQQPESVAVAEPVEPPATTESAAAQSPASEPPAAEPAAVPEAQSAVAPATSDAVKNTEVASTAPDTAASSGESALPPPQAPVKSPLNLGTVDYNDKGDIIFSGTATGGTTVRLYVDNNHVGDTAVESGGQWQFAGRENISPGTHSLRVDRVNPDGSVAERVELPFVRAEPAAVAALIEQAPAAITAEPAAAAPTTDTQPTAAIAQEPAAAIPSGQTAEVPAVISAEVATAGEPPSAAPAAVEEVAAAEEPAAGTAGQEAVTATETAPAAPAAAPAADAGLPQADAPAEPPAAAPAAAELAAAAPVENGDAATASADPGTYEPPAAAPAAEEIAAADPPPAPAAGTQAEAPAAGAAPSPSVSSVVSGTDSATLAAPAQVDQPAPAAEKAALAEVAPPVAAGATAAVADAAQAATGLPRNGKIVIQPGNSLWRISRVIYGQGVQYTIIYQANKEQIRNPDLIYPGQIFATPGVVSPETIDPKRKEPLPGVAGGTTSG